jgi:porin-like protein
MKRLAVLGTAATFAVASIAAVPKTAHAQLTMQMGNGWSLSFSGNVNAFEVETVGSDSVIPITYGLVNPSEGTTNRLRTGLLPAFAVFDAKGKEGPFNIGVHFGFAPQIQNGPGGGGTAHDQFGAQIDMRQVYLTVGGEWGQILAGRELGLYQRQNILTDMTLFGVGANGGQIGNGGTTLGRIGFGYIYPNFVPQVTYSSPADKDAQLSIGLFDPSAINGESGSAAFTKYPRLEAEFTWSTKFGSASDASTAPPNKFMFWVGGSVENASFRGFTPSGASDSSRTAEGADAGIKLDISQLSIVASGYYARGIGTTLMFQTTAGWDATGAARKSYGYVGQIVYQIDPKWNIGGSFGSSNLKQTDADVAAVNNALLKHNLLGTAEITYQWTKSLKWVAEGDYIQAEDQGGDKNHQIQLATGFMLFF